MENVRRNKAGSRLRALWVIALIITLMMTLPFLSSAAYAEGPETDTETAMEVEDVSGVSTDDVSDQPSLLEEAEQGTVTEETGQESEEAAPLMSTAPLTVSSEPSTIVEAEMNTASESIKAATADLSLNRESNPENGSALQTAIDKAVRSATEGVARVVLKSGTDYSGGGISLTSEAAVDKFVFVTDDTGTATIHNDLEIGGVLAEFINVLFGQDCLLITDNGGKLVIGSKEERFTGSAQIMAGDAGYGSGTVTVYAGNGASITSDVAAGTVTVINSAGDSLVFYDNKKVGVSSEASESSTNDCTVLISAKDSVSIDKVNAWDVSLVVNSREVTVEERDYGEGNELRSFKIIAASENTPCFDLTEKMGLSNILSKIGVTEVLNVGAATEKARVLINAGIKALKDITVYSYTTQTKDLISTQFVDLALNVKLGSASIELKDGISLEAGNDITLKATTRSNAGYDDNGKAKVGVLPVAFNYFGENASIYLGNTTLVAGRDVTADALSSITANAACSFGALSLGVAFNIITNNAYVEAVGTTIYAGRDVNLNAKADTKAVAEATRSTKADSLDGLYMTTNVVIQSSEAKAGNGTQITARTGDVNISSTSDVDASDDAIASVGTMSEQVSAFPLTDVLKTIGYDVLGGIKDSVLESDTVKGMFESVKDFLHLSDSALVKAQKYFETDGYAVEIDSASQEKGTVKTGTVSGTNGKLSISVDSKYKVDEVRVRYLPYGSNVYKFAKAELNTTSGSYELDLKKVMEGTEKGITLEQFRVYVLYSDTMKSEVEMDEMPDENADDDEYGLSELFDNAMESASDDSDADPDCGGNIELILKYKFKDEEVTDGSKGSIVTDAMSAGVSKGITELSSLTGVAQGKNVRFNPNAAAGFKVKSMIASYTNTAGETKSVTIEKNNAGHYVLAVPTDIKKNSLTITTEFEPREEAAQDKPSENHKTGSLAVGVVVNHNDAVIDLGTGSITTTGKVNLNAEATTNITGKADGTAVTEAEISSGKTTKQMATDEKLDVTTVKVKDGDKETEDKLYVYGKSVKDAVTAVVNGTVYTVTLSPNADYGFLLPDTITLYVLGEDNREHAIAVSGKDGTYTVDTAKIDFKTDTITDEVQEGDFAIRSTKFIAIYDSKVYKVTTDLVTNGSMSVNRSTTRGLDTITVKLTPDTGYSVESLCLRYSIGGEIKIISFVPTVGDSYICTLDADSVLATWDEDSIHVSAVFEKMSDTDLQTIKVDGSLDGVAVDKTKAANGEKVTIRPADGRNLKLNADKFKVTYKDKDGKDIEVAIDKSDFSFIIPVKDALSIATTFTVNAEEGYREEMKVPVAVSSDIENGTVTINYGKTKTGAGDVLYVTVKGTGENILKAGTLAAEFKKGDTTIKLGNPVRVSDGVYKFTVSDGVGNDGGQITICAKFAEDDSGSSSLGGALAVNVGVHRNNALIRSGSINSGKGVAVTALTNGKAVTESLAGYGTGKTGIAGAVSVGVVSFKTNAMIGKGVSVSAGDSEEHELSVDAQANISALKTEADASNSLRVPTIVSGKTGVGTGIAVAVNGVDTKAAIQEGVLYGYNKSLEKASASASNTITADEVNAKAGARSNKTAVTPVVALNIVGSNAKAYIGRFANEKTLAAKLIEVKASNSAAHKMTVNTEAFGAATAMTGSFGINIIDDTARAILNSDVKGTDSDILVDAQSVSTLEANVKATAMGANPGKKQADDSKGSADQKADGIISSGEKMAAKSGMESAAPTEDMTKNRQQAQTAEGSVAGAAAFILNIQDNISEARIEDSVILGDSASSAKIGDVSVASRGMTSADITADGTASSTYTSGENRTGIGVAVAINIVKSENTAYLGKGTLNAGNVTVAAGPTVDKDGKKQASVFTTSAISGASASGVSVAGSVALAVLNNSTSAIIEKAQADIYNAVSTTIRADDLRTAETTASASKSEKGRPDKNATKVQTDKPVDADMSKSVGVGASFAMVYGDNNVVARFHAPSNADTGAFLCEAVSDHSEESTAVAGTDPYKTLCDPADFKFTGKSSAIAVDAAVAVNAIHSTITARLAPSGTGYTPTVNASSVRLNAAEKGHSKTDSSGYAMGTDTAVGGSVAVNLNTSSVSSGNECFLKVSGDDFASDDGEDHQRSVEITAASEVTEENIAYAMAAGGDLVRYVEKYKSLLSKIDTYKQLVDKAEVKAEEISQIIKGFLDGSYFRQIQTEYEAAVNNYKTLIEQIKADIAKDGKTNKSLTESAALVANSGNRLAQSLMNFVAAARRVEALGSQVYSLSSTLLVLLGVGTPSTQKMDETTGTATSQTKGEINAADSSEQTGRDPSKTELDNNAAANKDAESLQIAAAVGVSVSNHEVIAENKGDIETKGSVLIEADNSVDAIAHSAGYAASINGGTGSIALAIAVKVDSNTTRAVSEKNITVGSGRDVIISANLKENTNNFSDNENGTKTDFTSEIGTEAIAGAVSGSAKVAISGAVVVFVSSSDTLAELADNAIIRAAGDGRAGDVCIRVSETARQTMRTAAVAGSSANLTLGISVGVLVTENTATARAGKNTVIKARNIAVEAERKSVSLDSNQGLSVDTTEGVPDFGNKDKPAEGEDEEKTGPTAVDVKDADGNSILVIDSNNATQKSNSGETLKVDLDQDKVSKLLENALNMFAGVDYYIAVDSGCVAAESSKASSGQLGSIAGSVAVVTIHNTVSAIVDENAMLDSSEDVSVKAESAEQSRLISGAISVNLSGNSKVSTGAVVAFLYEQNSIEALVENGALITAGRDFSVSARNTGRSEAYTVTASGSGGSKANIAATVDVILSEADVRAKLGDPGADRAHTAETAKVIAENSKALRNITVSLAGGKATAQVGGAVAVILENSSAVVTADSTKLYVSGKTVQNSGNANSNVPDAIVIRADNTHDMFVIVASASVAGGATANVAGVVSVILDTSEAKVSTLGSAFSSNVKDKDIERYGSIVIAARNESTLLNANVQAALTVGASTATVGAAVTANILRRSVVTDISTAEKPTTILLNNGDISLTADAADKVIILAAGANGSASNVSVQGSIVVLVENNTAKVNAQKITLDAPNYGTVVSAGNTTVRAKFTGELYGVAGGVNFTMGSTAAGATVVIAVTNNETAVDVRDAVITGAEKIDLISSADTKTLFISIGAAVADSTAVEGSVVTVVASDKIAIHLGSITLESKNVLINALGKSSETYISGAVAASASVSVGPSVLVFIKEREIVIDSTEGGSIGGTNGCNVTALAETDDDIFTLVLAMAASGKVSASAGICVELINNTVTCDIDADINAGDHKITAGAKSDRYIANYIFGGGFSGTVAVVPVATVIYLTDKITSDVSGALRGHTVSVTADTDFALKEVAAGVAVSGEAGIAGTFAIVVNNSDTRAIFSGSHSGEGCSTGTELNVLANDNYKFNSLMVNVAGAGAVAVGVTAAVTVIKNNVLASVGDAAEKKTIKADKINVSALSERDVNSTIGDIAFGGTAAASVNVSVVVAGSKLPQDAFDMMTSPDDTAPDTFNGDNLLSSVFRGNAYVNNHDYLNGVTLAQDIQGNDKKDSGIKGSGVDGSKFVDELDDKDTSKDYTPSENSAAEAETLRGEDSDIDPTGDDAVKANAGTGKSAAYTYDDNAITAAVQAKVFNVTIDCRDLTIDAEDIQTARIDSVTGAVGGEAAASVGVSVLVLHSNVLAELEKSADVTCRELHINAYSGAGENGEISVVGGAIGAGTVGVAVAVNVVHLDDVVKASLAGNVTAALADDSGIDNAIYVIANSDYQTVKAYTLALGAGAVGVHASTAIVSLNGTVQSVISGNILSARNASGQVESGFYTVNSFVFFNNSINARAASFGGGGVDVTMGVAVATETLKISSGVEKGAKVELDTTNTSIRPTLRVLVAGSFDEDAYQTTQGIAQALAEIDSFAVGGTVVGVSVAVAYLEPQIRSYIDGTVDNTTGKLDVAVGNNLYTKSNTGLARTAGAGSSFGANVLLAYNTTKANATVTGELKADTLTVMSLLSANAVGSMESLEAAAFAMGISTVLSILNAENEAAVGTGAVLHVGTLNILAGATAPGNYQDGANFFADAQLYSGAFVAGLSVNLNVAVALNKAVNKASLETAGNVFADTVNVFAYGNPTASSITNKFSGAIENVSGSAAASSLNFRQLVTINCENIYGLDGSSLTSVNAGSYMYPGNAKDIHGEVIKRDYNQARASVDIFEIAVLSVSANISYAKNKTVSSVLASFASKIGPVKLINNGSANSSASIVEAGAEALGIGGNVVLSYVQAQFITELKTKDVEGNVDLLTDFVSDAGTTVKAASSKLVGLNANVAVAKSTTKGSTVFNGNNGTVKANTIYVRTIGESTTRAEVLKPSDKVADVSAVVLLTNIIESILKTDQEARLENMKIAGAPQILVNSRLNDNEINIPHSALARYEGSASAVKINALDAAVNVLLAKNYASNLASASNITHPDNPSSSDKIQQITVSAENKANAFADVGLYDDKNGRIKDSDGFDVSMIGVGVIVSIAHNKSENTAKAENISADAKALNVTANQRDSSADSFGGTSSNGVAALATIKVNVSEALNIAVNKAIITGCGTASSPITIDKISLLANAEDVHANAYIGSAKLTVAGINIATNLVTATNSYDGSAVLDNSYLKGSELNVQSLENQHSFEAAYDTVTNASVGSAGDRDGKTIAAISGSYNSASAVNNANVIAKITGAVLSDYAVSIFADGRSDVSTDIAAPANIGLMSISVIKTDSRANGTVLAEFDPTDTQSSIASLDVKAFGEAYANALTGVAGSLNLNLVSASVNSADASIEMLVKALVSGGKLRVANNADINSVASAVSSAEAQAPGFAVSLVDVGINTAKATSNIQVETAVEPGEYIIGGQLNANARIAGDDEEKYLIDNTTVYFNSTGTNAVVRPSLSGNDSGSTNIHFVGGENHTSDSVSEHRVTVNIGKDGKGTIRAGSIRLGAEGNAHTKAESLDVDSSYGLVTAGGSVSTAVEKDITEININTQSITADNSVDVTAQNKTVSVDSNGTTPGGISVASVTETTIRSKIEDNVARINVNGDVTSTSGSIALKALNNGTASTGIRSNSASSALAELSNASAKVEENYTTEILFGNGSNVQAENGLTLKTDTFGGSNAYVYQENKIVAFNAANLFGESSVNSTNNIKLGENAAVSAGNSDLTVAMINRGDLYSVSDFGSGFELLGANKIKAEANFTAVNNFEMASGSSVASGNGNVNINQSSSDLAIESHTDSTERQGLGDTVATGINTVKSDNILKFADIRAGKAINVTQFGGAKDAEAYGRAIIHGALANDCECSGVNNFTINNRVEALDAANLNAGAVKVFQGTDKLNLEAAARPFVSSLFSGVDGAAENNITVNNTLSGGTRNLGSNKDAIFVSEIDASGSIVCDMDSCGGLVTFDSTSEENKLYVTSAIGESYASFSKYQNKFNENNIIGSDNTVVYVPDGLPEYHPSNVSSGGGDSAPAHKQNRLVEMFRNQVEEALTSGKAVDEDGLKLYLDEDDFLVVENSGLFAANLDEMDIDWLYEFLCADDIRFMANFCSIEDLDLNTSLSSIVNSSVAADDVIISGDVIRFSVEYEGEKHIFEIVFNRDTGKVSSYCLDENGNRIPVSIVIIEQDGVLNLIVYHEGSDTEEAFILIPDLVDGKLPVIRVKIKDSILNTLLVK